MKIFNDYFLPILLGIAPILIMVLISYLYLIYRAKFHTIKTKPNDEPTTLKKGGFDDVLKRRKLAKKYYMDIKKFNTLKHNRFSIEGSYGYGKTFIADSLSNIIESDKHISIKFVAWERDEYYSPIDRLLIEIYNKRKAIGLNRKTISNIKKLIKKDPKYIKLPFKQYIKKYDVFKSLSKQITLNLKDNKKIFIIIDELDRATKTDSVEFLEITNQLFSNNGKINIIYLYDFEALKSIIKHSTGIDTPKYINKFIDFRFKLSNASYDYLKIKHKGNRYQEIFKIINPKIISASLRECNLFINRITFYEKQIINNEKMNNKLFLEILYIEDFIKNLTNISNDNSERLNLINLWMEINNKELFSDLKMINVIFISSFELMRRVGWQKEDYEETISLLMQVDLTKALYNAKISSEYRKINKIKHLEYSNINETIINLLKIEILNKYNWIEKSEYSQIINNLQKNKIEINHSSWPNDVGQFIKKLQNGKFNSYSIPNNFKLFHKYVNLFYTNVSPTYTGNPW